MRLELDPAREQAELERYLGERFRLDRLHSYEAQLDEEFAGCRDEASFYRSSEGYLYNLTAFAMTGTKLPYLRELTRLVPPGSRLLDYGCGIGADGLLLLEAGYEVEFADFDNPSVAYLRWRLRERGLEAPVHDLDRGVPAGFDAAYAFDVIEHVSDPIAFLAELEARADLVVINLLEPEPGEPEFHHELPIAQIGDRAVTAGLRSYEIHHGRSHLLAYEPGSAGALRRLRGRWALASARRRA
jgi:SAM-dependent methyltransferase